MSDGYWEGYRKFAETDRQMEIIDSLVETGSIKKTSEYLGVARATIQSIVRPIKKRAAIKGYAPELGHGHQVLPGFGTKRISQATDSDGVPVLTWHIQEPGAEAKEEALKAFLEGLQYELKPAKKPKKKLGAFRKDIRNFVVIGDAHLGMLAHKEETLGEDFNIDVASADLRSAIDFLVKHAPAAEEMVLINVGDFVHADTPSGTTTSGTRLDTSVRHARAMRVAGATLRYLVDRMRERFPRVRVINAKGNHDEVTAVALSMFLEGVYEKDDSVVVEPTEGKFHFIEFGANLVGVNHGDKITANRLGAVMARDAAEAWGRTKYRRWWIGHIHHKQKLALDMGCTIESFNTLAATDAWHAACGYGGERGIELITLHRDYGEFSRVSPSLEMVRAIMGEAA